FSFIGNEYRVQVGNHDYYVDLLFYHRGLSCLVAFELKIGEFKPEYIGKMNLYLEALDREVKKQTENHLFAFLPPSFFQTKKAVRFYSNHLLRIILLNFIRLFLPQYLHILL
ncbi:hypothetical protein Q604_UNBC17418G0001, partial [human gut metagenome]